MKVLKIILFIVLGIVVIVGAAIFIAPTKYHTESSIVINAPHKLVMQQTGRFENFVKWNPFNKLDTAATYTIEGKDGTPGAKYSWAGNSQAGEGNIVITSVADDKIEEDLNFIKPFPGQAKVVLAFDKTEGGVKVTWGMDGESPRPMNLMNFMMTPSLEKIFAEGLGSLKSLCENIAAGDTFKGFQVTTVELSPRTYIGKRDTVKWADMTGFFTTSYKALYPALTKAKAPISGSSSGLYFVWDEANQQTVMSAAVPVAGEFSLKGFDATPVSGKALKIEYFGKYEGTGTAHSAMDDYMTAKGLEWGTGSIAIEEYVTGPEKEPDTTKWQTDIYYLLK